MDSSLRVTGAKIVKPRAAVITCGLPMLFQAMFCEAFDFYPTSN
jgi:hypothetical protein